MIRSLFILMLILFLIPSAFAASPKNPTAFTQGEFARMIISEYGWQGGLPPDPGDRDYLVILGGKKTFKYEAESAYNPKTDNVTVKEFKLFGPFTGKGWIMGVSKETSANLSLFLPIGGEYTLKAVLKGKGFSWKYDNRDYPAASPAALFAEVEIGKIIIKPGVHKIFVRIPPEGAIDSFTLAANDNLPIQPLAGWRFKELLTAARMAETGASLSQAFDRLPAMKNFLPPPISAVEASKPSPEASPTKTDFLGSFKSREWLRANHRGATIQMPVKVEETGYYGIRARMLSKVATGSVNGIVFSVSGKPYLELLELGLFRLESGENTIIFNLPPMGGIDQVELTRKDTTPSEIVKLMGLSGSPDRQVSAEEAGKFIKDLMGKFPVRK